MSITFFSPRLKAKKVSGSVTALGGTIEFSSDAWSMPDLSEGGTIQITLNIDEGPQDYNYAPHLVRVEATATGYASEGLSTDRWDESDHKVYFIHDWGEPGERFTVPENLTDAHRNRNTSISPNAAHLYRKPGTYNYHVLAFDASGNYGYKKAVFTVKEDDFNQFETVVLAADGDFNGCPTSANKITSFDEITDLTFGSSGKKCKVWIKRGLEYQATKSVKARNYFFDVWGEGPLPIISSEAEILFHNYPNPVLRFSNIHFKGLWSAVNDMATDRDAPRNVKSQISLMLSEKADIIFDRCVERGTTLGHEGEFAGRICFHEHDRSDCRDFLFLGSGEKMNVVMIGSREVQEVTAANGTMNRDQFINNGGFRYIRNSHNGIRLGFARSLIVSGCDIFARCGWTFQNIFLDNPILRINTNSAYVGDKVLKIRMSINRNNLEGDISNVEASGVQINMLPISGVVEQNNMIMTASGVKVFNAQSCGWTIRDNKFQRPNTPPMPSHGGNPDKFVSFNLTAMVDGKKVTHADNYLVPNYIYNNSFVNLDVREIIEIDFEDHNKTSISNNVSYHPAIPVPLISDGPFDLKSIGFEARYLGLKRGFEIFRNYQVLAKDILPNETVILPYGKDWYENTTNAGTFARHWDRHQIGLNVKGDNLLAQPDFTYSSVSTNNAAFAFEADGIHVTNLSADTWASGMFVTLLLDRGDQMMEMDPRWATPAGTVANYGITESSGAYQNASGLVSMSDFYGNLRPGTGFLNAPEGTPSRGALEPA